MLFLFRRCASLFCDVLPVLRVIVVRALLNKYRQVTKRWFSTFIEHFVGSLHPLILQGLGQPIHYAFNRAGGVEVTRKAQLRQHILTLSHVVREFNQCLDVIGFDRSPFRDAIDV